MPQIPDFTAVGNTVPTPSYRRPFLDESGAEIASSITGLGAAAEQMDEQQKNQNVAMARAQASNALLDHQLTIKTTAQDIQDQVASGQLSWDQAAQTYQDKVSKLQAPTILNLDPLGQQSLTRGMQQQVNEGQLQVTQIARNGQRQAFSDQFGQAIDKLGKLAGMPGADINDINSKIDSYRPLALTAGIAPATVDKAIQNFKDQNWLNQATQRSMEAKDNMGQLQQLQHDLVDPDGTYANKLDTDKRNIVLRSVINDQLVLQSKLEHESDKREAKAQSAIGQIDEQISSGVPATPSMWEKWQTTTQGTSFEQEYKQRLGDEDKVQSVLRLPIDQQEKYVQDQASALDTNGGSLRDRANLIRLQTAVNQNVNLLQKAPLLFNANRNGTEVQPLNFTALTMPDGQQAFSAQIADRMASLKAMRTQYGASVTPSVLLPQEAGQLSSQLENADYKQRTQMLLQLRQATGDDVAYQNIMRQVAPHSPVTAIAGQLVNANAPANTPSWYDNNFAPQITDVQHVLHGEELLNPASNGKQAQAEQEAGKGAMKNGMPMPQDAGPAGMRAIYGRAAGDLFRDRPEMADAYYSVFKDAYASLLAQKGDMKGLGDPTLQQQALKIALGNTVQFNGSTVSVPRGMDPSNFNGLLKGAIAGTMQQAGAPADWQQRVRGYGLRELGAVGSGQYMLVSGNTPILRPDKQGPIVVDMRDQYLGARGAHRGTPDWQMGQSVPYTRQPSAGGDAATQPEPAAGH
ncbi:MAG TPA: hypothetical protein VGG49_13345 [Steroidobacteraceae bacterium]|jgi:hypothetical protein